MTTMKSRSRSDRNGFPPQRAKNSVEVLLKGGLGNQLFQYAAARALARHVEAPIVTLNLSYLSSRLQQFKSVSVRTFELSPFITHPGVEVKQGSGFQGFGHKFLGPAPFANRKRHYLARKIGYDDGFWSLVAPITIEGYFQSEQYFRSIATELRSEFCSAEHRLPKLSQQLSIIRSSEALGVHIRRGDYLTSQAHSVMESSYYRSGIERVLDSTSTRDVYFFSDDPEWVSNQSFSKFGKVVSNGSLTGAEELLLLSACSHFVIANSSFSWWAAWLGTHRAKMVIAPREWFEGDAATPDDRFPDGWVTLSNE